MIEYLDFFVNLLELPAESVLVSFLIGYLICREIKKKEFENGSELDKTIFSLIMGVAILLIFRTMMKLLIDYFDLITFTTIHFSNYSSGLITGRIFLLFLVMYSIFNMHTTTYSLKLALITTYKILIAILSFSLIISISSFSSSFNVISYELSIISFIAIIIFLGFIPLGILGDTEGDRVLSKIYSKYFFKKWNYIALLAIIITISSVFFLPKLIFPEVTYGDEQITYYVVDISRSLSKYDSKPLIEYIVQPVEIERLGMLSVVFFENKVKLIFHNESFNEFMPNYESSTGLLLNTPESGIVLTNTMNDNLRKIGVINISRNEKYDGFVLRFDNLNKSKLSYTAIGGYRKIKNADEFIIYREDTKNISLIKIYAMNKLDAPVILGKQRQYITDYNIVNETCLIYNSFFELYNTTSNEKIGKYTPQNGLNEFYAFDSPKRETQVIQLQIYERRILNLNKLYLPPHTNLTVSFEVLCN